ncbi:uncharacterized protein [Amphiura filiformis]|uniref:uncharacterized protein n=1 Tax=Amphiura filiformis TaxID=82378 RepID=UPI003B212B7B
MRSKLVFIPTLCACFMVWLLPTVDGLDDLLRLIGSFVNDNGQMIYMGRTIQWSTKGRVHSADELWVYDGTAWDIASGTSVEVKHYKESHDAKKAAVDKLITRLKQEGIIKDEIHGTDGKTHTAELDDGSMEPPVDPKKKDDEIPVKNEHHKQDPSDDQVSTETVNVNNRETDPDKKIPKTGRAYRKICA